jgi:hypothetical protein
VPTAAERAQVADPISQALLQFWPTPNTSHPGSTINYIANVGASTFDNTGLIKIDHNFSDKDHLTGRWAEYQGTAVTAGVLPSLGGTSNAPISRSGVLTETHIFTPNLLNEFRFGFSRNTTFLTVTDAEFDASPIFRGPDGNPLPGVVNGKQNLLDSGLPTITVSGGYAVFWVQRTTIRKGVSPTPTNYLTTRHGPRPSVLPDTPFAGPFTRATRKRAAFWTAIFAGRSISRIGAILQLV